MSATLSRSQTQRRKRIVQTAAALAVRGGVEAMQMRSVAERAGVALGTLYRYFPSKMDLVVAVVTEELDLLEGGIVRRPPTAATPAGRAVDVLLRATRGLMREPELADALVRSLMTAEVKVELDVRITDLLWRVATDRLHPGRPAGESAPAETAAPETPTAPSAPATADTPALSAVPAGPEGTAETDAPQGSPAPGASAGADTSGTSGASAAPAATEAPVDRNSPDHVLVGSLTSVWILELVEILKGRRSVDEAEERLHLAAEHLLRGF